MAKKIALTLEQEQQVADLLNHFISELRVLRRVYVLEAGAPFPGEVPCERVLQGLLDRLRANTDWNEISFKPEDRLIYFKRKSIPRA